MKRLSFTYKLPFLVAGIAFAPLTYACGVWIYEIEQHIWPRLEIGAGLWGLLAQVPAQHPVTFSSWLLGVAGLALLLGSRFDRQVQLRTRLEALAVTDSLTLIYNRRYFIQSLSTEIKRTQRMSQVFALLLLDVDDFKGFNDRSGHMAGDDTLRLVAQTVQSCAREIDVVARYGGDEFVVIATGTIRSQAALLAERIRGKIEEVAPVTVSVGVAGFPEDGTSFEDLIRRADGALYRAKEAGKNRVSVSEQQLHRSSVIEEESEPWPAGGPRAGDI